MRQHSALQVRHGNPPSRQAARRQLENRTRAQGEKDQRVIDELFEEELDRGLREDEDFHQIADELMEEMSFAFSLLTEGHDRLPPRTRKGAILVWSC